MGKLLVKVKYISLVNLIMDKPVVKELIQQELTAANLEQELRDLLTNNERRLALQRDYADLKKLLHEGGDASAKAARSIVSYLKRE